ncbi:MAG: hypothetical protein HQM09_15320 [Candidatus Riflebacteria bacterium]|nr:hypothetical protein [Candidatus Riflebacteria bacterium]
MNVIPDQKKLPGIESAQSCESAPAWKRKIALLMSICGLALLTISFMFTRGLISGSAVKTWDCIRYSSSDAIGAMIDAKVPNQIIENFKHDERLTEKDLELLSEIQREKLDEAMYRFFWGRVFEEWGLSEVYILFPVFNVCLYLVAIAMMGFALYLYRSLHRQRLT